MRNKAATKLYYLEQLSFEEGADYDDYLILFKGNIEIHFFEFKELNPKDNYGQVYIRTDAIDAFYQSLCNKDVKIHPAAPLADKPWGQREFSLLDPDANLITFGQSLWFWLLDVYI